MVKNPQGLPSEILIRMGILIFATGDHDGKSVSVCHE